MMKSQKDNAIHQTNNKENQSPPTFKSTPKEPSRTFHGFPLGGSAPSALPNFNLAKKDFLCRRTRSKSLSFNPNRVRNSNWSPTKTQVGLGAVGDLIGPTNTNKNLLIRPLVTAQLPMISHSAPPVSPDGAHSGGLCSKLATFLLQRFGTRVPKVVEPSQEINNRGNRTRMSSDRVLADDHPNSPRKKAKRSEDNDEEESFVIVKNDDFPKYPTSAFMNFCFGCHKRLKQTDDIYIYRGEMAFCSSECRKREMFTHDKMQRVIKSEASSSTSIGRKPTIRDLREA